ncbi:MAG: multifunctional CCA tRNA nucleotidyl transferase/2'3'-cyclic phosphodiesterase/2'nucleotidase/phosphatase [Candidatus Dactylopiibacterium carminicum]|uniref:Multifunctional CCA protein n=1 Tax=Candidatus Dactylopiibacterium carminicum TaxID=857335 RepID=A0A272EVL8_9RHOO|nr:multifunctional CCA addition/repair protein [Candidatus Dactylopiibacterium carminicum]KAF7599915.1 multifunctional CCA addition/repair protein [Candidatus Dactylopiibacterium carminicum]PAS94147.1 MAG: multifunctional CCA tRNA nucleotidyl transferase/2'3'-cyclic phosphodiesterase/2'nucleotidase/phosphatase [Candidatus Dactylopiibacterium carminicum]PAS96784.1 MAG: multifunctional CCA tRNA nucleotidyl transferase/2'3'-cyclic phosphodiesterase/2'nucleotidase/phosphatase [Candidatus Dactylopiib
MNTGFQTYIVGGAVRDRLLGLPVQDRDWVIVGATPETLLAAGYKPVGKDFPVFLHPQTREECALARTERKTAPGYKGFVFHADASVTLEEDLIRRDLTINAMAEAADGTLVDPFGGQRDIAARVFRHVSPAFAEDPVRILRVARFAARFSDFAVAPETLALMRGMVEAGEVDHLVPERVWQELSRGLMYERPARMITVLRDCGALTRILPELDALFGVPQPPQYHPEVDTGAHILLVVDRAAQLDTPLPVRWAALLHDLGKGLSPRAEWPHHYGHENAGVPLTEAVCARLRVPVDCRELAVLVTREHGNVYKSGEMQPPALARFLERLDLLRRPERFEALLLASQCDAQGRPGFEHYTSPAVPRLRVAAEAFRSVDAGAIARATDDKTQIPARVQEARVQAVRTAIDTTR